MDARYLKLTGGTLTGNLTLPSEYDTGNLTAPSLTFSGNSVSQTAGQLGYIFSVSGSSVSFSNNTLISPGGISSLPIGVYILTVQIIINNNDATNNMVISKLSYGCSTIGSTTTPNNYLYEITNESITIPIFHQIIVMEELLYIKTQLKAVLISYSIVHLPHLLACH